jgi:hypothetical protein
MVARGGVVVAIEPDVKSDQIIQIGTHLSVGYSANTNEYCCHDFQDIIREPMTLHGVTSFVRERQYDVVACGALQSGIEVLGMPPYPVMTWNNTRNESVVIARFPKTSPDRVENVSSQSMLNSDTVSQDDRQLISLEDEHDGTVYITAMVRTYVRVFAYSGIRLYQGMVSGRTRIDSSLVAQVGNEPLVAEAVEAGRVTARTTLRR